MTNVQQQKNQKAQDDRYSNQSNTDPKRNPSERTDEIARKESHKPQDRTGGMIDEGRTSNKSGGADSNQ